MDESSLDVQLFDVAEAIRAKVVAEYYGSSANAYSVSAQDGDTLYVINPSSFGDYWIRVQHPDRFLVYEYGPPGKVYATYMHPLDKPLDTEGRKVSWIAESPRFKQGSFTPSDEELEALIAKLPQLNFTAK